MPTPSCGITVTESLSAALDLDGENIPASRLQPVSRVDLESTARRQAAPDPPLLQRTTTVADVAAYFPKMDPSAQGLAKQVATEVIAAYRQNRCRRKRLDYVSWACAFKACRDLGVVVPKDMGKGSNKTFTWCKKIFEPKLIAKSTGAAVPATRKRKPRKPPWLAILDTLWMTNRLDLSTYKDTELLLEQSADGLRGRPVSITLAAIFLSDSSQEVASLIEGLPGIELQQKTVLKVMRLYIKAEGSALHEHQSGMKGLRGHRPVLVD